MPSVTGQENTSERIIALRLASLKSDHIPDAPVSATCTFLVPSAVTGALRSSAARTIVLASALAPAITIGGVAVAGDRRAGLRQRHRGDAAVGLELGRDLPDRPLEGR